MHVKFGAKKLLCFLIGYPPSNSFQPDVKHRLSGIISCYILLRNFRMDNVDNNASVMVQVIQWDYFIFILFLWFSVINIKIEYQERG